MDSQHACFMSRETSLLSLTINNFEQVSTTY